MLTFLTSHSHLINIMTVKKHHVVKYPHMRQLRLAPHHALHDTSNICMVYPSTHVYLKMKIHQVRCSREVSEMSLPVCNEILLT